MKIELNNPPRKYIVGKTNVEISDCGKIYLDDDEQVTFVTKSGKEHDFCAKDFGFYTTPSINHRLKNQGFKTALTRNSLGRYYLKVVDADKIKEFEDYVKSEDSEIIEWLDERK